MKWRDMKWGTMKWRGIRSGGEFEVEGNMKWRQI